MSHVQINWKNMTTPCCVVNEHHFSRFT